MKVQAINSSYRQNQKHNYNQKANPSFTALKGVAYRGLFRPDMSLRDAKMVKGLLDNPAFQKFSTKYDVFAEFFISRFENTNDVYLYLYCKEALEVSKRKNMFQKIKNFFKTDKKDKRDVYQLFFNSKYDSFNTISETELEKEFNRSKKCLIAKKQDAEKHAEILKSIEHL